MKTSVNYFFRSKPETIVILLVFPLFILIHSCRKDDPIIKPDATDVGAGSNETDSVRGFFLLNEGNMGSNKASLDYFDYETGVYYKNIYADRNPYVTHELGDVGNDIQIYGNKLYAVINCSNLIEVMDVNTAEHITSITVPNCRYIVFDKNYAYVSSYSGPVLIDPNARLGYVAKIDTATYEIIDTCNVGYQPEEMVIYNNKLYVANSGGYRVPDYDNTVSVIDLESFTETNKIIAGINLHRMEIDNYDNIYVSSRGDYYDTESKIYVIDPDKDRVSDVLNIPASDLALCGDSLYICSTEFNYDTGSTTVSYTLFNTGTQNVVSRSFIKDGTEDMIETPYGIAVNPETREFFVTDAGDYLTPGTVYCFDAEGNKKWEAVTGDIPAHIVFTRERLLGL